MRLPAGCSNTTTTGITAAIAQTRPARHGDSTQRATTTASNEIRNIGLETTRQLHNDHRQYHTDHQHRKRQLGHAHPQGKHRHRQGQHTELDPSARIGDRGYDGESERGHGHPPATYITGIRLNNVCVSPLPRHDPTIAGGTRTFHGRKCQRGLAAT